MTAVADHDPFREPQPITLVADPVDINSGRKQVRAPVAHDAQHEKRRFGRDPVRPGRAEHRQADDMALGVVASAWSFRARAAVVR